jgi:hypothetical protein
MKAPPAKPLARATQMLVTSRSSLVRGMYLLHTSYAATLPTKKPMKKSMGLKNRYPGHVSEQERL